MKNILIIVVPLFFLIQIFTIKVSFENGYRNCKIINIGDDISDTTVQYNGWARVKWEDTKMIEDIRISHEIFLNKNRNDILKHEYNIFIKEHEFLYCCLIILSIIGLFFEILTFMEL